jgi:D-hydroxyproline dehydrogenase subunit alpha
MSEPESADRPGESRGSLSFDGRPVPVLPGQSIGAVLVDAGVRSWRTTRKQGRPRGLFCGIGICYDCLVTVDGVPNQRACLTPARPGMVLSSDSPSVGSRPRIGLGRSPAPMDLVDLAVVGAGPAGLAAAGAAAEAGLSVTVIDSGLQPGGQYWRHPDESSASIATSQHDWGGFARLRARFDHARRMGRLSYQPNTQVWFLQCAEAGTRESAGFDLRLTAFSDVGPQPTERLVKARSVVLCPGGYDRQLPVPGWDLPGVMAAGGVQALLKGYGTLAGKRAVVAGTGPFLLPVAIGLAEAGAEVVGICEAAAVSSWLPQLGRAVRVPSKGIEAVEYAAKLGRNRVPFWTRTVVTAIGGADEVRSVSVARVDGMGRVRPGTGRDIDVDLVALGWGFTPSLELVTGVGAGTRVDVDGSLVAVVDDSQRTTVPSVYAAGEVTGVGGAVLAVLEGQLAGLTAAADHGRASARSRVLRLRRAIARSRAFATAMHRAHTVPPQWYEWLTPETVICRCEEVTYAEICQARDELGADDARTLKLTSRPGMGWCQGRVCGFATARLASQSGGEIGPEQLRPIAKRPFCAPVSLEELANSAD